ncbi:hypothetical protein [Enterococcus durans]|uniref:hypothetical protein n=1 Tax=Enterococcus durans TaxID=53345 RepID=UPI001D0BA1D2|nr:hypothetical protein [Enterococcus durans]MCB8514762.1 hypothetical protein [Enterococcus durans]
MFFFRYLSKKSLFYLWCASFHAKGSSPKIMFISGDDPSYQKSILPSVLHLKLKKKAA